MLEIIHMRIISKRSTTQDFQRYEALFLIPNDSCFLTNASENLLLNNISMLFNLFHYFLFLRLGDI